MLFSSPTFQSEIHKTANDKQQITLHIKNTVSCNAQSSVESHKATKLFRHQHAINHPHLPHCTDGLCIAGAFSKGSCKYLHICDGPLLWNVHNCVCLLCVAHDTF